MALIRLSLVEAVILIKQNITLPAAISHICAVNRRIEITTAYGLTFLVAFRSFFDGWLELEVKGTGWLGRLISATLGAKLLDLLAPQLLASGIAQTRGNSIFWDIDRILGSAHGFQIRNIEADGDCLTIMAEVNDSP